jgi:hypothetical protein
MHLGDKTPPPLNEFERTYKNERETPALLIPLAREQRTSCHLVFLVEDLVYVCS